MNRREFITLLGGAAATWPLTPLTARAQQPKRMRRIGVVVGFAEGDKEAQTRISVLQQALKKLGWSQDLDVTFDIRWTAGNSERATAMAKEVVGLQPDVIVGHSTPVVAALLRETRTIPIVFVSVTDPIGQKFALSFPRPGGNITGFVNLAPSLSAKWLDLLKQIAPRTRRVALLWNPDTVPHYRVYLDPFEAAAPKLGFHSVPAPVRSVTDIEVALATLASEPDGGFVVMPDIFTVSHRKAIIAQADRHRVPGIYPFPYMAQDGGLLAYGIDTNQLFRQSASYVDRILRGERPEDLPIQQPTKFEMTINLKTANSLGITIPSILLATADEVLE